MLMDGLWLYDANGIGHHLLTQGRKDGRLYLTLPYAFKVDPSLFLYGCSTLSSSGQKSPISEEEKVRTVRARFTALFTLSRLVTDSKSRVNSKSRTSLHGAVQGHRFGIVLAKIYLYHQRFGLVTRSQQ